MKLIAHRVFRDEHPLGGFDPGWLDGFDGAELDLRETNDGSLAVFHSPILTLSRRAAPGAVKAIDAAFERLESAGSGRKFLFLDVKTDAAVTRIAELSTWIRQAEQLAFIIWRSHQAAALKAAFPTARVLLGLAPLRGRGLTRGLPKDLTVFNRFPYLARSDRYRPRQGQFNQHSIGVRRFDLRDVAAGLPAAVDGLCFHKLFFDRRLAATARRRGLKIAVYGFTTPKDPKIARVKKSIDFAIVDPDRATISKERVLQDALK